jgi:hypothetical protein
VYWQIYANTRAYYQNDFVISFDTDAQSGSCILDTVMIGIHFGAAGDSTTTHVSVLAPTHAETSLEVGNCCFSLPEAKWISGDITHEVRKENRHSNDCLGEGPAVFWYGIMATQEEALNIRRENLRRYLKK